MFQRFIDDLSDHAGHTFRLTALAIAVAVCLFVTTSFLCAAAFVAVLSRYGLVAACLTGAGIFFVATLLAAILYAVRKRQAGKAVPSPDKPKSGASSFMPDPMMIAAALPIVRAIGLKKLVPVLALAGLALGIFAARQSASSEDEDDDSES